MQFIDPRSFVESVETYSARTFTFKHEIVTLLETAQKRAMMPMIEDIIFNAKFITQALNVLKRVGAGNTDTEKLANELKEMMEKTTTLLRTLMKESPEEIKHHFLNTFFSLTNVSMANLTRFLYELSWVKNYLLDQQKPS